MGIQTGEFRLSSSRHACQNRERRLLGRLKSRVEGSKNALREHKAVFRAFLVNSVKPFHFILPSQTTTLFEAFPSSLSLRNHIALIAMRRLSNLFRRYLRNLNFLDTRFALGLSLM